MNPTPHLILCGGGGGTDAKPAMTGWPRIEGSLLEFKMYNKFEKLETKKLKNKEYQCLLFLGQRQLR
jgi:hypothetical protein